MKNPASERRAQSKVNTASDLSRRAAHVIGAYFQAHPDNEIRKLYEEKAIDTARAYKLLLEQARDPLTGVQRRDILPHVLDYEMQVHRTAGAPFTVGFFDIDDFKRINTEFDHDIGDRVLKHGASVIAQSVRESDDLIAFNQPGQQLDENIARHGGEEFLVIYPNTTRDNAFVPAERLRTSFAADMTGVVPDGRQLTLSGGLVEYDPQRHSSWEALLKEGSQTVLAAKAAGKNRIVVSDALPISDAD
jgi:diguanylate cyclase (GGDEF)-like protein